MDVISLVKEENGRGCFVAKDGTEQIGEMIFEIAGAEMTVFHTEVAPKAKGTGTAKRLLEAMVAYARENSLMVIPMCAYVHIQFKRHPEAYGDIWKK